MPTFAIQRGPTALAVWDLETRRETFHPRAPNRDGTLVVNESDRLGFVLDPAPDGCEHQIIIGDMPLIKLLPNPDDAAGASFGGRLFWRDFPYFESARNQTQIVLRSRADSMDSDTWETVLAVDVYVLPSKLGEESYQKMADDLQNLNRSLLIDLYGKSKRSYDLKFAREAKAFISTRQELESITAILDQLGILLGSIRNRPASRIKTERRRQNFWGGERLPPAAITWLSRKGGTLATGERPIQMMSSSRVESFDLPEHRVIRAFLELLIHRARYCGDAAHAQSRGIASEQHFRDLRLKDGFSLYESVDVPKIKRLREAIHKADQAVSLAKSMTALPFLRDVPAEFVELGGGAFQRSPEYRTLLMLIRRFLLTNAVWYEGEDVMTVTKLTSRLFEQWCYLRLVEAFRSHGVELREWSDVLRQSLQSSFVLDFDRGLMFEGMLNSELRLRFRYEPWILGERSAATAGETLCRGSLTDVAWSPDVVIECMRKHHHDWKPVYGIVLDCKYTAKIQDQHWNETSKYLTIRRTDTMQQVVKQLWLISPGNPGSIHSEDPAVRFDDDGPSSASHDTVRFHMTVAPSADAENVASPDPFDRFAAGTIRFLVHAFGAGAAGN